VSWRLVLTVEAEEDLDRILLWSHRYFGVLVREGYEALIIAGIEDVANSPMRVGSRARPELGASVMGWHLAQSRDRVAREVRRIDRPRHVIVYRVAGDEIHILRLLHEAMSFSDHVSRDR
jgi:toxin ParE1/3/4